MTVNEMLAMLQDELEASKKAMFNSKRLVDADKCLDLIDEIVEMLPVELERAANIIKERKQILSDAESEAQQYLEEARRHAEDLVQETEIVKAANVEANGASLPPPSRTQKKSGSAQRLTPTRFCRIWNRISTA